MNLKGFLSELVKTNNPKDPPSYLQGFIDGYESIAILQADNGKWPAKAIDLIPKIKQAIEEYQADPTGINFEEWSNCSHE